MARTAASLPSGSRITDYISLGVLTKAFPLDKVAAVVAAAGKTNQRQRDLPAHVVVYYVIALTLYSRTINEGWVITTNLVLGLLGLTGLFGARRRETIVHSRDDYSTEQWRRAS
jgi:MYXO-CTERM domain-containing protein